MIYKLLWIASSNQKYKDQIIKLLIKILPLMILYIEFKIMKKYIKHCNQKYLFVIIRKIYPI